MTASTTTSNRKLTRNQALVLQSLNEARRPLSAYAILDELRQEGLKAPLQVYRALDKLMENGLVHRLESLNAFVACSHPHSHDRDLIGFAVCENCGKVDEFTAPDVEAHIRAWCHNESFKRAKTTLEIHGLCRVCRPA